MASTYSDLKIQLMTTGENATTWGSVTNTNLGTAIEEAIVGSADVTFASGNETLTLSNSNATQTARNLRLNLTGTTGGSTRTLTVPDIQKVYVVNNGCGDAVEVKNSTGSNVSVPAGKTMWVYSTGTNVVDVVTHLSSLTLASPLPVASGGTGSNTAAFSGANITNLNASAISSGTIANARTTASDSNGASTIVARDASGNFSANTITADLTGTAANATVLETARTIAITGGVTGTATSFNGSANISINVTAMNADVISAGTLANARTTASSSNGASTIVARDGSGDFTGHNVSATHFIGTLNGSGANVSSINASNISSGTLANARTTASSSNGASTIVTRDASGNFSANTVTANLTGNVTGNLTGTASNATVLETARTIAIGGGVTGTATSFNGSANITINTTAINASVISAGTLANARTTAASANGASTIVARDASGNFSANTITADLTGTAANATVLETARTIAITGGATGTATSFNGSANISINVTALNVSTASAGTLGVARGGTGATTLNAEAVVIGNGTSAVKFVAPGTSGNVLTSNGSAWISSTAFVAGMIMLWSGSVASIPSGWALCNGTSGTPDLRNRFVVGAGDTYAVDATGGSANATLPSHTHTATSTVTDPGHFHTTNVGSANNSFDSGTTIADDSPGQTGSNTTGITVATSISTEGSSATNANLPPYYALAYIMKL
jgi:hypothetical protein